MKLAAAIAFAFIMACAYYFANHATSESRAEAEHRAWKYSAIEKQTLERPERFEAMKWHPDDAGAVEMRAPASVKKSHH